MTVVICCPPSHAPFIGGEICRATGRGLLTKETPRCTYFHCAPEDLRGCRSFWGAPGLRVEWFETAEDAVRWHEWHEGR